MSKSGVTAIITTYNEAEHIEAALQSVSWADEILVMDSFSTDETPEIIRQFGGVCFLQHAYDSPAKQKNRAIELASFPWVFILDADERVPEELREEMLHIVRSDASPKDGYWIQRKNIIFGQTLKYLWKGDKVIRLIRKDKCRYQEVQVHEEVDTAGVRIGMLEHPLLHYSVKSMEHYLAKTRRYARWQAEELYQNGARAGIGKMALKPLVRFAKHYFVEGGFLDGRLGFIFSVVMAWGVWLRYVFLYEKQKKR